MKTKHKIAIGCSSAVVVLCFLVFFVLPRVFFGDMIGQVKAGKSFMDSLTEADINSWISKSEGLLSRYSGTNGVSVLRDTDIPDELRALRIIRVDIHEEGVNYVWMGGFDHTCLSIQRQTDGGYLVTARYDDNHCRRLWPKENR